MDIEKAKEYYFNLDTDEIMHVALFEAQDLKPEALDILRAVILQRKNLHSLLEALEIQRQGKESEYYSYVLEKMLTLPCPVCGNDEELLDYAEVKSTFGLLMFWLTQNKLIIGCPDCIYAEAKQNIYRTIFLGFLAPPLSWFSAINSLLTNYNAIKISESEPPSALFEDEIIKNLGAIKYFKLDENSLGRFIQNPKLFRKLNYKEAYLREMRKR